MVLKMRRHKSANQNRVGFTLIEVLMAVLLIAILATIAITQFTNFSRDTKNATTKENLGILRSAIQKQFGMMRLRCQVGGTMVNAYPSGLDLINNDITAGGSGCTPTDVPETADRYFVSGGIPQNPWSDKICTNKSEVFLATTAVADTTQMNVGIALADGTITGSGNQNCGWIYDQNTGRIKAKSNRNNTDRDGFWEHQY